MLIKSVSFCIVQFLLIFELKAANPAYIVTTYAGSAGQSGSADGVGSNARFALPFGSCIDSQGNVYVADQSNHVIRKITPNQTVTTLAGLAGSAGFADGTGSAARFSSPYGVGVDSSGNVFVADTFNNRIRKITPQGVVTTYSGNGTASSVDGSLSNATFSNPWGIAFDTAGNMYVCDQGSCTIRKITTSGTVTTIAGTGVSGYQDGPGASAQFRNPNYLVLDTSNNIYLADKDNCVIRKITPSGVVSTYAGIAGPSGYVDGNSSIARFSLPTGICIDSNNNLYISDYGNGLIREVSSSGIVSTIAGQYNVLGSADGPSATATFNGSTSINIDSGGNFYVVDRNSNTIRKLSVGVAPTITTQPQTQTVIAGSNVTLSVVATGTAPLTYQWYYNSNVIIPGATSSSYTLNNIQQNNQAPYTVVVTNSAGSVTSNIANVFVNSVPSITTQPVSQTVNLGSNVTFSVTGAANTQPVPTYQWYKDGVALPNQTSSTFTLSNAQPANIGYYTCTLTNSLGSVTTSQASLNISGYTFSQWQGLVAQWKLQGDATDSLGISNGTAQNIQWQTANVGGTSKTVAYLGSSSAVGGVTVNKTPALDLPSTGYTITGWVQSPNFGVTPPPNTYFTMLDSQGVGGSQQSAYVLYYGPQGLDFQVSSLDNYPNSDPNYRNIKFVKTSDSNADVMSANQWYFVAITYDGSTIKGYVNGVPLTAIGNTSLIGVAPKSTTRTTGIGMPNGGAPYVGGYTPANNGSLSDIRLYNRALSASDIAAMAPAVGVAPTITTQPQTQTVIAGSNVTLSVVAIAIGPITYQWYYNGSAISGATSYTYTIPAVNSSNAGSYSVVVTNSSGSVQSSTVTLTVNPAVVALSITTQPSSTIVTVGNSALFSVGVYGTPPYTYQWYYNGNAISGATSANYTLTSATSSNAGSYYVVISNSAGSIQSSTVTLTVNPAVVAPSITTQPLSQAIPSGSSATLNVVASGTGTLTYQWFYNGNAIAGATSSSYILNNFSNTSAGNYYVTVSNSAGSVTSSTAILSLQVTNVTPPVITTQPQSQGITAGSNLSLSVQISGNTSVTYQWFFNGNAIAGATSSTYSLSNAQSATAGSYNVEVLYSGGNIFSNTAIVTVTNPVVLPTIISQPQSQSVNAGSNVSLSVVASSQTALTYQWYFNGNPIGGATASTYALTNVQAGNAGSYTVSIGYPGGAVQSSAATLTVISSYVAPVITAQPQSQSVNSGTSVTFNVTATGTPAPSYQWYFNGVPIAGATSTSYTVANVQPFNSGSYNVLATNPGGSYASNGGILTVTSPNAPKITSQPTSLTSAQGATVTFSVSATGVVNTGGTSANASGLATRATNASTYQWYLNGLAISGATNSTLVTTATASNAGNYQCMIVNTSGSTMSTPATLAISQTTNPGRLVNLSVLTLDGSGSQMLTLGFASGGAGTTGTQSLLIRGSGPALTAYNVPNVLPDPTLTLFSGSTVVNQNAGWGSTLSNQIQVLSADAATGAFVISNSASADSAFVVALSPTTYTVQVASKSGVTGNALAEVYDNTPKGSYTATTPRLVNLSCLQQVVAKGILTAGFVINGDTAETVLIRVSGPALTTYNVPNVMPDPQLSVFDSNSNVLGTNAGWGGSTAITTADTSTGAFPLTDPNSADSAILLTLNPGSYTVQASSVTGKAGAALIEVYEVK